MAAATASPIAPTVAPTDMTKLFATIQKSVVALSTSVKTFEKDVVEASSNDTADNPFACPDGISLLTVKNDAMLDYLHHVVAVCITKISGRSLVGGSSSSKAKNTQDPADLVQNLVKLRLMLEKLRPLENRLKYQMDKLLRAAADADKEVMLGRSKPATKDKKSRSKDDVSDDEDGASDDDLAFRPNPSAFMQDKARASAKSSKSSSNDRRRRSGRGDSSDDSENSDEEGGKTAVYRPPKLVPMSYDPDARNNKKDRSSITRNSALLSDLTAGMSSNPYEASSAGVGVGVGGRGRLAANTSARAKALARMEEFEEENFTRLVQSKKDARKRRRDEADVALGGAGLSSGRDGRRRIGGGMEEEFGDLLRGAGLDGRNGKKAKKAQNAYDALRSSSKVGGALQRSKSSGGGGGSQAVGGSKSNKFKNQVNRQARR